MKSVVETIANEFGLIDILYSDGSKDYETFSWGYVRIERPEVVGYIESILSKDFRGFSYLREVENLFVTKKINSEELQMIVKILD